MAGVPGEARRSGSTVAQDRLVLELWSMVFENPFFSSGCSAVRCLSGIAWSLSGSDLLALPAFSFLFLDLADRELPQSPASEG